MAFVRAFLLAVAALVAACGHAVDAPAKKQAKKPEPPRPTVNHAAHKARDLECIDCHDPDETGTPVLPSAETCFECHETLEEESDRVKAYFATAKQADGSYKFQRPAYFYDLVPNHPGHAKAEVECAACHGEPSEKAFARPDPLPFMQRCLDCHAERGATRECAVCHKETRADKPPLSHDAAFRQNHGRTAAPEGWRAGEGGACAICHKVPQGCTQCHSQTKPASHETVAFHYTHGKDTDAWEAPWDRNSCSLCHERQACVRCHQVKKPRSHTRPFERRLHGIQAEIDRQSCMTCHKQDFCINCHQHEEPISHRGQWGTGQQSHCAACHEPLNSSGCYTCHKNTLGHLQAPPLPGNAIHQGASDPDACEQCHVVLPHFDDGGRCKRCHR